MSDTAHWTTPDVKMNIHQDRKATDGDKQLPGCLGVMVNLFDVSAGLARNKLLTDGPHHDGSPIARSLSDVAVTVDPFNRDQVKDERTTSNLRSSSNRKSNITPIKLLIAQEMSREFNSKQSPPNLVAKLMGLDALPIQLPKSITQKNKSKSYLQQSRSLSYSGRRTEYSHHGRSFSDDQMQHRFQEYQEYSNYRDIYDMWQQSPNGSSKKGKSSAKARSSEIINEQKMALVREKFMEAKRLAPNEKLRQSKEFQDAVELLSSNRDLFLKILQEPKSLFSKHMHEYHSIPLPPETKRITILKPLKMVDDAKFSAPGNKSEYLTKKSSQDAQGTGWDQGISGYSSPYVCQEVDDYPTQPTQIVLLKPGHSKSHDIKSVVPPPSSSLGMLHGDNFFEGDEDDEVEEMKEVEKEITRQMHENPMGHRRDETLLFSVFSNDYIRDDGSINRLENDCLEGNLRDLDVISPTSRHSWDFINRIGSPYSTSSFSRASYSPESSVCKEAKRRLFERWALMASNENSLEQKHAQKRSSTLGEMLALPDSKKSVTHKENGDTCQDQESAGSSSSLTFSVNKEEAHVDAPKYLSRSKSVPVSSAVNNQLNVRVTEPNSIKSEEPTNKATGKSSLKWRVSSLFFSRGRNSSKDKTCQSEDESRSSNAETARSSEYPDEKMRMSIPNVAAGISNVNHEQPSLISILDQSFEEDEKTISEGSGKQVSSQMLKSNMIDKSPPIGSLARTLSWEDSYTENTSSNPLKTRSASLCHEEDEEDEQDWLTFIQTLLSAACLKGKDPLDSSIPNWYSPDSPLDPSLRDKFTALDDKGPLPEAKRRQGRSNRKLAFDCTSTLIVEMTGRGAHGRPIGAEQVWAQMKGWFTKEPGEGGGGSTDSLVVERVVRDEVVGTWWVENLRLEADRLGLEIEGKLLEDLVDEAVGDLSGTA